MSNLEGQTFAGYEILARLGEGGMGAVYKARQPLLNRIVALKVMAEMISADPVYIARFIREATTAANLRHPNIVEVFTAGEQHGVYFLAMEFVEGESLKQRLGRVGRIAPREAVAITLYVAQALQHAWNKTRLIHRDIKPDNIFLSRAGEVKVGDLGLAKIVDSESTELTQSGVMMGSPHYISPEQAQADKDIDFRTDIYSLGCTLYHSLTGQTPYEGDSSMAVIMKHVHDPPPAIFKTWPQCPMPLGMLVGRMLAKDRAKRPSSYEELVADLFAASEKLGPAAVPAVPAGIPIAGTRALAPSSSASKAAVQPPSKSKVRTAIYAVAGVAAVIALAGLLLGSPWKSSEQIAHHESSVQSAAEAARLVSDNTSASATNQAPVVNTLFLKVVPVPIRGGPTAWQRVLFSIWETRVQDYEVFAQETHRPWPEPDFQQGPTHPAVNVSWDDAKAFCLWLTERERRTGTIMAGEAYRLPSDHEWSCAVGIGDREDPLMEPVKKKFGIPGVFPWGSQWPPPPGAGNFVGEEVKPSLETRKKDFTLGVLNGYQDGFINTAPVGSFDPNIHGLFDLSGNAWEWCEDWFWADGKWRWRVLRGGDWCGCPSPQSLGSDYRHASPEGMRYKSSGFRCVLAAGSTYQGNKTVSTPR